MSAAENARVFPEPCLRCNGTGVETDENGVVVDDVCSACGGNVLEVSAA